ncbi:MAG: heme NO-binding domain-containing protein [Actinomycetota bacterium]
MVNRAITDLVISTKGEAAWEAVCARAGLDIRSFDNTRTYDDAITYDLVAAAAAELDLDPATVLEAFGRHWILFTGREGWGPLFAMAGDSLETFVEGLDGLHARVVATMPQCRMPSFAVERAADGALLVDYRSDRDGLAPMVLGLLNGLAEHFGESWRIEHLGWSDETGAERFSLQPVDVAASTPHAVGTP